MGLPQKHSDVLILRSSDSASFERALIGGIVQVNYNLMSVNFFMALTGLYQLSRKLRHDYGESLGLPAPQLDGTSGKTA